jgi:hypothetical protein
MDVTEAVGADKITAMTAKNQTRTTAIHPPDVALVRVKREVEAFTFLSSHKRGGAIFQAWYW